MTNQKVFACIPTYCEPNKVEDFLQSMRAINYSGFEVFIVNANFGDLTSEIIDESKKYLNFEINEIAGKPCEFWSATVNRGLREILKRANREDWILIMNIDIEFDRDIVSLLTQKAIQIGNCQLGAVSVSNDNLVISSGIQVKSWLMTLNRHPLAGYDIDDVSNDLLIPVNYLPTRCMIFPASALSKVGLISEKLLPHYAADYEFSSRLTRAKYSSYIYTTCHIKVDVKNTGNSSFSSEKDLLRRLLDLMSIKNPSNPWYRIIFVILVYPIHTIPTAVFLYLTRTFLETIFGGKPIQRVFKGKEHGFS
jgi:GT2 family glycosyltransferase